MDMEEKVSIIVPVYNAAPYLGRCMDSLLGQTYPNTEILLVDDGSTDASGGICDGFAHTHSNVRVFHTPNAGVSAARNRGMEECRGEYLTFVDADDVLADGALEALVRMMEEENGDVAGCGYFEFRGGGCDWNGKGHREEGTETGKGRREAEVLRGMEFVEHGILRSDTRCWSKLYRKGGVGGLRFDTGLTIGEDMLFLLDLALQGKTFVRNGYQGYGYFVNENGAMRKKFQESYMDQIVCWQKASEKIGVGIKAEAESGPAAKEDRDGLISRTEGILAVSAMLVVGKLAVLPGKERRKNMRYGEQCLALVKKYGKKPEVLRQLDRGYRMKVRLYGFAPGMYMVLYRLWSSWKGQR